MSTRPSPGPRLRVRWRYHHCGRNITEPLQRCRRRRCPDYADIWAGDQRQKLFANMIAYAEQVPDGIKQPEVLVGTVTAPGVEGGMPWEEQRCRHLGPHRHSGEMGCRVQTSALARFNETVAERFRRLHRRAYQRCVGEGLTPWMLLRVFELQKREALHVHPVLAYSTLAEKRAADRYIELLDRFARHYGFGTSTATET